MPAARKGCKIVAGGLSAHSAIPPDQIGIFDSTLKGSQTLGLAPLLGADPESDNSGGSRSARPPATFSQPFGLQALLIRQVLLPTVREGSQSRKREPSLTVGLVPRSAPITAQTESPIRYPHYRSRLSKRAA